MSSARQIEKFTSVLPYAMSLVLFPIAWYSGLTGELVGCVVAPDRVVFIFTGRRRSRA